MTGAADLSGSAMLRKDSATTTPDLQCQIGACEACKCVQGHHTRRSKVIANAVVKAAGRTLYVSIDGILNCFDEHDLLVGCFRAADHESSRHTVHVLIHNEDTRKLVAIPICPT